ncbi:MAG: hypothetical protein QOH61_1654 [Chloroflexota bacterium]|nr:hypothetical protein [Chloroflexota bacterium]
MIRRQTVRPTPRPLACGRAASPRKNGVKICSDSSAPMPMPRSMTTTRASPPSAETSTSIGSVCGLYLSALLRRFSITSSRQVRSASTITCIGQGWSVTTRSGWRRLNASTAFFTTCPSSWGSSSRSRVVPAPRRASIRRFSTMRSSRSESSAMSATIACRTSAEMVWPRSWSRRALPKTVVTGVRSSCDTSPRNSSFTALEARRASAVARRSSSARTRSVTSTSTFTAPTRLPVASRSGVG